MADPPYPHRHQERSPTLTDFLRAGFLRRAKEGTLTPDKPTPHRFCGRALF